MSLPSGYTRLEYIGSSGTQWVDTGFKPDNNTKIEMRVQCAQTANAAFFGGATTYPQNAFECFTTGAVFGGWTYWNHVLYSDDFINIVMSADGLYKDNTKLTSFGEATFTSPNNLALFARNRNDGTDEYMTGKTESCKIYDNGTLIRDFIPCKNASGAVGLWDDVGSQFYGNAGTGAFTAGPEVLGSHKVMVGGTIYDVTAGQCMVGGTVYDIQKGLTMIGGTVYEIPLTVPVQGTPVGNLPVGTIVKTPVNGTAKEFIVVHQGLPSSLYDASCSGTWLLMKDCYETRQWHNSDINAYAASTIHSYLNGTFLNLFDAGIKAQIKQVKIPYAYDGTSSTVASGANGLSAQIFLLSGYEVGWTTSTSGYFPIDGACLSYFSGTSATDSKRIAYLNGSAAGWWLRSPSTSYTGSVWFVSTNGGYNGDGSASSSLGIRPAFILPSDALVDENMNLLA